VNYWSDEFDAQKIISRIDHLLNTEVNEHDPEANEVLSLEIVPNPFSKTTDIRFMIQNAGYRISEFSLQIYDVMGRLVKQYNYPTIQLSNQISWDGTDHKGNVVSSGVYFVHFESGKDSVTKSVVVSR
jgi:flagellar hook assembly protein FlgD